MPQRQTTMGGGKRTISGKQAGEHRLCCTEINVDPQCDLTEDGPKSDAMTGSRTGHLGLSSSDYKGSASLTHDKKNGGSASLPPLTTCLCRKCLGRLTKSSWWPSRKLSAKQAEMMPKLVKTRQCSRKNSRSLLRCYTRAGCTCSSSHSAGLRKATKCRAVDRCNQ